VGKRHLIKLRTEFKQLISQHLHYGSLAIKLSLYPILWKLDSEKSNDLENWEHSIFVWAQ